MRPTRLAALLLLAALAGGCTAASTVTFSTSTQAPTVAAASLTATVGPSSGPTPSATATPRNWVSDPAATAAGASFTAAAERVNAAVAAAYRTYPVFNARDLEVGRGYFRLAAATEAEFVGAVKTIPFPSGMEADVASLLEAEAALVKLEQRAVDAKTLDALDGFLRDYLTASRVAADASFIVRRDLGLPNAAN